MYQHSYCFITICCAAIISIDLVCGTEVNESVYCQSGETFASSKLPEEFSIENLSCKDVPGNQTSECNTTRIDSSSLDGDTFLISCGDNGYIEGYDVYLQNGNFSGSYIEYSVNITLCRLESLTKLDSDTYDLYPAGSETKFGNSSSDYSYSSLCDERDTGDIVTKIDSVWSGPTSYDRGIRVICKNLYNDLGLSSEISDSARRRIDMPEPFLSSDKTWTSGCKDNEVLVGVNSYVDENDTRRFEFLCYEYIGLRVIEETCKFRSPDHWLDHSFRTFQDGSGVYAFRGVKATFISNDLRPSDRNFEYEVCMVATTNDEPLTRQNACSFNIATQGATEDSPIRQAVFMKYRTEDVHECGRMCSAHPFCHSFAWDPTQNDTVWWTCEMSYYESEEEDSCSDESEWITEFRAEQMVTVQCFNCQTQLERNEQLYNELELNNVFT